MRTNVDNITGKKVSAIAVNFNGKKFLKDCIESLKKQKFNGEMEMIIVDNNSTDGSIDFIKSNYQDVILIENTENKGHSEASNQGAEIAQGDYLFFIDNDTVFEENCIHELLYVFTKYEDCGAVGGMIKDYGNSNIIQDFGLNMDIFGYPVSDTGSMFGYSVKDNNTFKQIKEVFYVSSCCLMVPTIYFKQVEGFDLSYFIYKDDFDLCWRIRLLGNNIYVTPHAKIYHKMGVTLGGTSVTGSKIYKTTLTKRYYSERNTIRTLLKNYSFKILFFVLPCYLMLNAAEIFILSFKNPKIAGIYIRSYLWNMENLRDVLQHRKKIQHTRKIGDIQVLKHMSMSIGKLRAYRLLKKIEVH